MRIVMKLFEFASVSKLEFIFIFYGMLWINKTRRKKILFLFSFKFLTFSYKKNLFIILIRLHKTPNFEFWVEFKFLSAFKYFHFKLYPLIQYFEFT